MNLTTETSTDGTSPQRTATEAAAPKAAAPKAAAPEAAAHEETATESTSPEGASPESTATGEAAEIERISRDERNLAVYPIALLSHQVQHGKTISQTRERRHPISKKTIVATWKVLGSEEWGLPTPTDDAVVLVLLELSRELGFPQEVYFTQLDILKRLGWSSSRADYRRLEEVFNRLHAITIQSKNVFWDATAGAFINTGFHLIESFEIVSKPGRRKSADNELPLSRFVWSETLWKSFREGNLKPISLSFYFSLKLPIARRLFRFLDLVRYDGKPRYRIGLRKLCEEYLALTAKPHLSTYKHRLAAAHTELIEGGYLRAVEYETARTGGENVIYIFPSPAEKFALPTEATPEKSTIRPDTSVSTSVLASGVANQPASTQSERAQIARACHAVYLGLEEEDREVMVTEARRDVASIFWERLDHLDSPISMTLWEIVEREYEDQVQEVLASLESQSVSQSEEGASHEGASHEEAKDVQ